MCLQSCGMETLLHIKHNPRSCVGEGLYLNVSGFLRYINPPLQQLDMRSLIGAGLCLDVVLGFWWFAPPNIKHNSRSFVGEGLCLNMPVIVRYGNPPLQKFMNIFMRFQQ